MSFKTPLLCDRRIYDKKGKWKSPIKDYAENIFYFIKTPLTLTPSFDNYNREELKETLSIVVFGSKPFGKEDSITLDNGVTYKIISIVYNYMEINVMVKDMLKPRIESTELELE